MSVTFSTGPAVIFGSGETAGIELPEGFIFVEDPGEFLRTMAPDGKLYFVTRTKLIRCRIADAAAVVEADGGLDLGQEFLDETETIPLGGAEA